MISEQLKKENLPISEESLKRLDQFAETFLEWNKIHNLGGARDLNSLYPHILDSIYPLKFLEDFNISMDIGTGAGFPGLLLAICKDDAEFVLVEPRLKRVSFLNFVKAELALNNVEILRERVEEIEKFPVDLVTSKAVSDAKTLFSLSKRFLREDSTILLYKGKNTEKEVEGFKNSQIYRTDTSSYLLIKEDR